ncbi:MAG: MoaD/ThiS family protein [Chloroflexota bacterium]
MSIRLKVGPNFLGDGKVIPLVMEVSGSTVGDCLEKLMLQEPEFEQKAFEEAGKPKSTTSITINRVPVLARPLQKAVKDGDEIEITYTPPG